MTDAAEQPADTAVLELVGDIDGYVVERYYEAASRLLAPGIRTLVLDLSRTTFLDSTGISLLIRISELAQIDGGEVRLRRMNTRVRNTLRVAGMDGYLPSDD